MKKIILVLILVINVYNSIAQSGIAINEVKIFPQWEFPELNQITEIGKDSSILIKEFSKDGTIRMTGRLKSQDSRIKDGRFVYFDSNNHPIAMGNYKENIPVGVWQYFDSLGNVTNQLNYIKVWNYLSIQKVPKTVYFLADYMPIFESNDYDDFSDYLKQNIIFPVNAAKEKVNELVFVSFYIDKNGNLINPEIESGQNFDLNLEIMRVLCESPQWLPGHTIKGDTLNIKFTFPIAFKNIYVDKNTTDIKKLFDVAYPEGSLGFRKAFATELIWPQIDREQGIYGYSLSKYDFTNDGEVLKVEIINSLSKSIDGEVTACICRLINENWNKIENGPDTITFYMPIVFRNLSNSQAKELNINSIKVMDEVFVSANSNSNYESVDFLQKRLQKDLMNQDYKEALSKIEKIIRFEPFNLPIRRLKIEVLKKMGKQAEAQIEVNRINNYFDNKSIEELIKN